MGDDGLGHAFVMTPNPELDRVQSSFSIVGMGSETCPTPYDLHEMAQYLL